MLALLAVAFVVVPLLASEYLSPRDPDPVPDPGARGDRAEHPDRLLRPGLARHRRLHGGRRLRRLQLRRAHSRHAAQSAGRDPARRRRARRRSASCSACRACASRASISRWRRWPRSSSSTGCSCASSGSPTTRRRARSPRRALAAVRLSIDSADGEVPVLPAFARACSRCSPRTWCAATSAAQWMAIRDMDIAAEVIGIRPMYAKLSAFAVSSFIVGVAGALWAFVYLGVVGAARPSRSTARSSCCSWSSSAAWARSWARSSAPPSSSLLPILLNQVLPPLARLFGWRSHRDGLAPRSR